MSPAALRPPVPLRGPAVPPRRVPRGLGRGPSGSAPFSASLRPAPRGPLRSLRARRRPPLSLFSIFVVYADFLLSLLLTINVLPIC